MSIPPSTLPNKFVMPQRVADVEKLAANCDTAIRELTARFDRQPPRGERGETGPAGLSIKGDAGRDGKDGKDGIGYAGRDGMNGTNGRDGKDGRPGPDSAAVLAEARTALDTLRSEVADIALQCKALRDMNVRSGEYIEFLRSKIRSKQQ